MKFKVKNVIINNFINLSINQGVNILIAIIVTPLLFKNLGDIQYGLVNLSLSIFLLMSILISYGYHLNGPKQISISNNLNDELDLINSIISLRFFIASIIALTIVIIVITTDLFRTYEFIILLSIPILFSEAIHPIFYLQGKDNLSVLGILNIFSKTIYLFLILLFINNEEDAPFVNFFFGISLFIVYLCFWIKFYSKNYFKWTNIDILLLRFKENFQYFFSSVAGHISINSSLIILKLFVDNKELGQFALANRIALLLRMIPVFIIQSVLQSASVLLKKDNLLFNKYLNNYYLKGLIFTFSIGLFFVFFSDWVIIFFSGEQIDYASKNLVILSFIPFLATLNFKNIVIILVHDKKNILNKATWISLIFMVSVTFFMSFKYKGLGLSIALLISEIINFLIHYYLLKNEK